MRLLDKGFSNHILRVYEADTRRALLDEMDHSNKTHASLWTYYTKYFSTDVWYVRW